MPRLELRDTPTGPKYYLDGMPLSNNDRIELQTVMSASGWMQGWFLWNDDPAEDPWMQTSGYGERIMSDVEVRWIDVEPSPPPIIQANEHRDTMKDWEWRGDG